MKRKLEKKIVRDISSLNKLADKVVLHHGIKTDDITSGKKDVDPHRLFTGGSGVNGLSPTVGRLFECPGPPLCICSFF